MDTEAHALFHDTLEDIKQHQTFQAANVYQSSNRLDEVKHSHHKWCATRMHDGHIRMECPQQPKTCDDCCLARYVPSSTLKRLYHAGVTSRSQLFGDGAMLKFGEFKIRFPSRVGLRSYELLSIMVCQMKDCDCSGIQVREKGTPGLLFQDTVVESREQLRSMFHKLRLIELRRTNCGDCCRESISAWVDWSS